MDKLDFTTYKIINNALNSTSRAEIDRRESLIEVKRDFFKSLDVDKFYLWDEKLTDICLFLNTYNKDFSSVIGQKQEFTCLIDCNIETGSIIYNPKEDMYWLCMYTAQMDYIYKKGLLYRCNNTLRWKDEMGNLWEYPAHDTNATQYNSGIDQGRNVDYVTSQHKILTTSDKNTNNLRIDTRFFLGKNEVIPDVFKLTQNDSSSMNYDKGIVSLTLFRGQYDPNLDDIDNRVSRNVFSEDSDIPSGLQPYLSVIGTQEIVIGEQKEITLKNYNGTNVVWQVDEESSDLVIFTDTTDNTCRILIQISKHAIENIGRNVVLSCLVDGVCIATRIFKISGGV